MIEMLKVDSKFLYVLLTLAQEKTIKTERFPLIYADEFILSHTNETEYQRFVGDKSMEALHDRIIVVKVPYNLRLDEEERIYNKLIGEADFSHIHIAPLTIKVASMFAILSRLEFPKDQSLTTLKKMYLYNGNDVDGFTAADATNIKAVTEREGMDGVSPRYIFNCIADCIAKNNRNYITPIDVLRSIKDNFATSAKFDKEDIEKFDEILVTVVEEYTKMAKNEVQKAFFVNFDHEINNLLNNYVDNANAYLDRQSVENEYGEPQEPNEYLMRSIEEKVLKEALEKQLFDERSDIIRLTTSQRNPDAESLQKINVVIDNLVENHNYTADSANSLLRYVSSLMART